MLKLGINGLPNVGKSTLFNALTRGHAPAENYPFTTIEPNVGTVLVPDPTLAALAAHPAAGQDLARAPGVRGYRRARQGPHQGEGLGNQFLAHIRDVARWSMSCVASRRRMSRTSRRN
jgi:ribosome-binding ATPase YchF (GTP1/OBG family)